MLAGPQLYDAVTPGFTQADVDRARQAGARLFAPAVKSGDDIVLHASLSTSLKLSPLYVPRWRGRPVAYLMLLQVEDESVRASGLGDKPGRIRKWRAGVALRAGDQLHGGCGQQHSRQHSRQGRTQAPTAGEEVMEGTHKRKERLLACSPWSWWRRHVGYRAPGAGGCARCVSSHHGTAASVAACVHRLLIDCTCRWLCLTSPLALVLLLVATKAKVLVRLLCLLCSGAAQHRCCWPARVPPAAHSVAPQPHWLHMFDITIVADDHVYPPASVRVAMRGG